MDGPELMVLLASGFFAFKFFGKWYAPIFAAWPAERGKAEKITLGLLPVAALFIVVFTLKTLASFDVVEDLFWVFFYVVLGFAWLYLGVLIMGALFDISKTDDVLNMNNKAALLAFSGGFLGLTIIYAGANIGDGPGWWCVLFAGGLGVIAWIALALAINLYTHVFERITVERDVSCGIRVGCYLLASGIILGRASAGDWTSASMTVVEFMSGWPVLLLVVATIIGERLFIGLDKDQDKAGGHVLGSIILGVLLIIFAVASITLMPLLTGGEVLWKAE